MMNRTGRLGGAVPGLLSMLRMSALVTSPTTGARSQGECIRLPAPSADGKMAVAEALGQRRSIRSWARSPLTLEEISQLLWAAQGITDGDSGRTAPSAGALYPLELYLVASEVTGLEPGLYRYLVERHRLERMAMGELRRKLTAAASGQDWMNRAPAALVVAGVVGRTAKRYGTRARRYALMEVGGVAENVYLQATASGLGTTFVGAFDDKAVAELLALEAGETPFAILPVGRRRR
jgi:SagB-type dehydrogenase family enzyme